jgi:hypothetical protein
VSAITKGRFRRSLLGYRREEVDLAFAEAEERLGMQAAEIEARDGDLADRARRIDDLERVATRLSERVVEREGELRRLRVALARTAREGDAQRATLTALVGELEDVRRTARGQATRIRLRALREAALLSERIADLAAGPAEMRERLLEALAEAVGRVGRDDEEEPAPAGANGHARRDPADLFAGMVEVEIGPLSDFSQLVLFEDAVKSITATSEISVKRFSDGRATLEMELSEPVALLRELEDRCHFDFRIRDMRRDRLVLDVGD